MAKSSQALAIDVQSVGIAAASAGALIIGMGHAIKALGGDEEVAEGFVKVGQIVTSIGSSVILLTQLFPGLAISAKSAGLIISTAGKTA
jgi:hypothetical protein